MKRISNLLKILLQVAVPLFVVIACAPAENKKQVKVGEIKSVKATVETTPVKSDQNEDAADDPAVWIHPENAAQSKVIGSNKKAGIVVYNLDGEELFFYPVGNVNNLDVCYNFNLNGDMVDLVGGSNRSHQSISLMKIDRATGALKNIASDTLFADVFDVYGFCFYRDKTSKKYYAIVNGKKGKVEQYEMIATEENTIDLELVRTIQLESQVEGMYPITKQATSI